MPPPVLPKSPAPVTADEALRRVALEHLAEQLDMGVRLVGRCRTLASVNRGDRLGPLSAAARLMNSGARVAQALAHVGLVERRHRSIIERIQPPRTEEDELNSQKRKYLARPRHEIREEIGAKLERAIVEQRRKRLQQPSDPQEEANLRLQEQEWEEDRAGQDPKQRALGIYRGFGRAIYGRS
ncbi:MAG TPA: hypothetical protein VMU08_07565 [Rhizomicrobium sp.]|nr:hypothetical protein [Rhizomicrobium sp.]